MVLNEQKPGKGGYPQLSGREHNDYYVGILRNLYSGCQGELNAILLYTYQHFHFKEEYEEVAKIFEKISITEMKHLELLGEAIMFFGGDPKYNSRINIPYSSRCVKYETGYLAMLTVAMGSEKGAVEDYQTAASSVRNQSLKGLFLRIMEDEQEHLKIFQGLYDEFKNLS